MERNGERNEGRERERKEGQRKKESGEEEKKKGKMAMLPLRGAPAEDCAKPMVVEGHQGLERRRDNEVS